MAVDVTATAASSVSCFYNYFWCFNKVGATVGVVVLANVIVVVGFPQITMELPITVHYGNMQHSSELAKS